MSNTDKKTAPGKGVSIPGQPLEEAAADVASAAGKSLVRGLARLGNATIEEWASSKEARAAAAKLAIETEAALAKERALVNARRRNQLDEMDHQALLERRAQRLRLELAREQLNIESVQAKAIEYTESDPDSDKPREIDDDWLFMFSDFAQRVSDSDVQTLWARVLSSASVSERTKVSAASLQTLSLMDNACALDFQKFISVLVTLNHYPTFRGKDPQAINLGVLQDLGLVKESLREGSFPLADFSVGAPPSNARFGPIASVMGLTLRGHEIASAVFHSEEFSLPADMQQAYLQAFVADYLTNLRSLVLHYSGARGVVAITLLKEPKFSEWRAAIDGSIPPRLAGLLDWAESRYGIGVAIADH